MGPLRQVRGPRRRGGPTGVVPALARLPLGRLPELPYRASCFVRRGRGLGRCGALRGFPEASRASRREERLAHVPGRGSDRGARPPPGREGRGAVERRGRRHTRGVAELRGLPVVAARETPKGGPPRDAEVRRGGLRGLFRAPGGLLRGGGAARRQPEAAPRLRAWRRALGPVLRALRGGARRGQHGVPVPAGRRGRGLLSALRVGGYRLREGLRVRLRAGRPERRVLQPLLLRAPEAGHRPGRLVAAPQHGRLRGQGIPGGEAGAAVVRGPRADGPPAGLEVAAGLLQQEQAGRVRGRVRVARRGRSLGRGTRPHAWESLKVVQPAGGDG